MKNILILIQLVFCMGLVCHAQSELYALKSDSDTIAFRVVSSDHSLGLRVLSDFENENTFPIPTNLALEDADLILSYRYSGKKKYYSQDVVEILNLYERNGFSLRPREFELSAPGKITNEDHRQLHRIVWKNIFETQLEFGHEYSLVIEKNILGPVDCSGPKPTFDFKKQVPHWAAAIVGAAALGLAEVKEAEERDKYKTYVEAWTDGDNAEKGADLYDQVKNVKPNPRTLQAVGWSILGADLIWTVVRHIKIREKTKIWDKYCKKEGPVTISTGFVAPNNYTFNSSQVLPALEIKYIF